MSEQTCEPVQSPAIENDLLDPYENLIGIEVLGKQVVVPEKNRLLRCFPVPITQYDFLRRFLLERRVYKLPGLVSHRRTIQSNDKPGLACRMEVIEGMKITSMSQFIKLDGITK